MDKSVWKYSMHPNYFGEVTQWWGLFVIALAVPYGFITFIGPAYITFQIIKVSGVKLLDKHFKGNEEYDYFRHVNTFGGNPAACALALKNLEIMENEQLFDRSRDLGDYLKQSLASQLVGVLSTPCI